MEDDFVMQSVHVNKMYILSDLPPLRPHRSAPVGPPSNRPLSHGSPSQLRRTKSSPAGGLWHHQSDFIAHGSGSSSPREGLTLFTPTYNQEDEQPCYQSNPTHTGESENIEVGDKTSSPTTPTTSLPDLEEDLNRSPRNNISKYMKKNLKYDDISYSVLAALGGLMIGYLLNVTGGLLGMNPFLIKISHRTFTKKLKAKETDYCIYFSQWMLLFSSSVYLSAIVALLVALRLGNIWGQRAILVSGTIVSLVGICLVSWFPHIVIEVMGMILIGFGVGFLRQIIPTICSQHAPKESRRKLDLLFEISTSCGTTFALFVNYVASYYYKGWRLSFGVGGIPIPFLLLVACFVDATKEYKYKDAIKYIMRPRSRPLVVITTVAVVLRQMTGLSIFVFFGPFILQSIGYHQHEAFLASLAIGGVSTISSCVVTYFLRYIGRRKVLIVACMATLFSQFCNWILFYLKVNPMHHLKKFDAYIAMSLVPFYVFGSTALNLPHGWVNDSYPTESKVLGLVWKASLTMFMNFLVAQVALHLLCSLQEWTFLSLVGISIVTATVVYIFVPETTAIQKDAIVGEVWSQHWFWRRYMLDEREIDQ